MATITPWIAGLVESELENIIAWKSVVKPEPGASDKGTGPRFKDEGGNLKSFIGSPPLSQASVVQNLQKPGLNARAKIPMSDGDVSIPVILSDAAWAAYDEGIAEEDGDEPRKGDLLICKRIVVVSTALGPIDERITFKIEDLEYAGNIRIPIGKPTSLPQRPSIRALREKIESLALKNQENVEMDVDVDDEDEEIEESAAAASAPASAPSAQTGSGASVDAEMETVIDTVPDVLPDAAPNPSLNPQEAREQEEQAVAEVPSPLATHTSPNASRSSAQFQIDTQLQVEATQAQALPPPARNPIRRSRGGHSSSMGRDGFEATSGDNLTGPQGPTLHQRKGSVAAEPPRIEPPKANLLALLSKLPGEKPRSRTPEASAPVSAQQEVTVEEVVIETPAKKKVSSTTIAFEEVEENAAPAPAQKPSLVVASSATQRKRRRPSPTSLESTSAPRGIYRIPKTQQALLDDQSSWLPPAPGHEFPHPNVPVKLLKLWNTKAELDTNPPSQASPIALIERSSGEKSLEEVQQEPEADESESDSDELPSTDELIEWSQSQSRSQALPPDSSAGPPPPAHTVRPGSRDGAIPTRERAPSSTNDLDDTPKVGKRKSTQGGSQRESPRTATKAPPRINLDATSSAELEKLQSDVQAMKKMYINAGRTSAQDIVASQPASTSSRQNATTPAGSSRSQASPAVSHAAKQRISQQGSPRPPASGANARPVQQQNQRRPTTAPVASQPIPTGPKKSSPLADNHRGPVKASTQQTAHRSFKPTEPRMGSASATPPGAPTAPRAIREPRHSLPSRAFSGSSGRNIPDPKSKPYDGFYCPQPSGQRRDTLPSGPKKDTPPSASQPSGPRRETLPPGSKKDILPSAPLPSGPRRDTLPSQLSKETPPSGPKKGPPPSQTSRHDPAGTQASEMEMSIPRSLPPHHQQRRDFMRGEQQKFWLQKTFSTDKQAAVMSAVNLHRQYSEKYPSDPVSEKEFALLVTDLRPAIDDESETVPTVAEDKGSAAATAKTPARAPLSEVRNGHANMHKETRDEPRDRNSVPPSKCRELYSAWKNTTRNSTGSGTPKRKLNVLGWEVGE